MRRLLLVILFVNLCVGAFAQKEKVHTLKNIRGEYWVTAATATVTGREAMEYARENAKRKAIEQVCGSRVSVWDQVETSSAGESFNSLSINQVDGEVVEFEVIEESFEQSEARKSELCYYCVANIKVKQGAEPDPEFRASVEGLRSMYFVDESLEFTVQPYRDCHLKIFLFEDAQKGYRLYPNDFDQPVLLQANQTVQFPQRLDFVVTKTSDQPTETNRLVFVFTKGEYPFYHETTSRQEIERWMAMIPNNEKYIHFAVIDIRKR